MPDLSERDFKNKSWELLLSQPTIAASLFFMWLCGIIISFLIFGTNTKFERERKLTESFWFRLAVGFLPCTIIIQAHHLIVFNRFITTIDGFAASSLPSSLILASITFLVFIWRATR